MGVVKMKLYESIAFRSIVSELVVLCTTIAELSFPLAAANQKNTKMGDDVLNDKQHAVYSESALANENRSWKNQEHIHYMVCFCVNGLYLCLSL